MRVLITGMSGTGKSAVIADLARRGYRAVDLDRPEWSYWIAADPGDDLTPRPGQDWVWREACVRELLIRHDGDRLFVGGCATNMGTLFDAIDIVILLCAPISTIMSRLERRAAPGYGHLAEERQTVATLVETVEPLLRRAAHHVVDTARPVGETVDAILALSSPE